VRRKKHAKPGQILATEEEVAAIQSAETIPAMYSAKMNFLDSIKSELKASGKKAVYLEELEDGGLADQRESQRVASLLARTESVI
jgi:hypothetical protein